MYIYNANDNNMSRFIVHFHTGECSWIFEYWNDTDRRPKLVKKHKIDVFRNQSHAAKDIAHVLTNLYIKKETT